MYQHILVAVDGSPTSDQAVAQAAALAQAMGARVRLLHVIDPVAHISGFESPEVYSQQVLPALQKNAQAVLARALEEVARQGVPVDTVLLQNLDARVSQLVIEHAKEWGADLIVLGTHGRRGLQRLMMGSDAQDIACTAPVPVLLVRLPTDQ
ncbi:MAG: universal stress protein [Simplicispira sp.]|nr:universal stress protein [Simplicispira sp.]